MAVFITSTRDWQLRSGLEGALARYAGRLWKHLVGKGPESITVRLQGDLIIFRYRGILSPGDKLLGATAPELVRAYYRGIAAAAWPRMKKDLQEITGVEPRWLLDDLNPNLDERLEVVSMTKEIEPLSRDRGGS